MAYYTQDIERKVVTIDATQEPTAMEEHVVKLLIAAGYKVVIKSETRSKRAKAAAAKETIKTKDDFDLSKLSKEQKEELESILKGSGKGTGFFAARSYYKKCISKK